MHARCFTRAVFAGLLGWATTISAATIPSGYEKLDWNTGFSEVKNIYRHGQMAKLGEEVIYKQNKPTHEVARRNFGFRNGRLHTVSITFNKGFIEKKGIEQLLIEQKKKFGEGVMDRSQAPHMINYVWEGGDTKITFAYAPKRPDMTVIIFEQKVSGTTASPR